MRRKLVVGNWKMHGSVAVVSELIPAIRSPLAALRNSDVAVCPPFVYLAAARAQLVAAPIALGAQNVSANESGAFTGEVAAAMLADCGCRFVIVGHSERRALYGEDDATVITKAKAVLKHGMQPIVCVGETLEQREASATLAVVGAQLDALTETLSGPELARTVIAYEPVWAIGTGKTASPREAQEVHAFIRSRLAEIDAAMAEQMLILYGGSVKAANAAELFGQNDIDGGLVGGASLDPKEFTAICLAAE